MKGKEAYEKCAEFYNPTALINMKHGFLEITTFSAQFFFLSERYFRNFFSEGIFFKMLPRIEMGVGN